MRQLKISQSITNRQSESLDKYLSEISRIPLISAEEESRLAALVRAGDSRALHQLIKANLRFVISVAKQYQHQGVPLSDLINEGNLGLIKAAQKFDETKGFKFISYAIWWIRQSIMQAITEHAKLIRVPTYQSGMSSRIHKVFQALEQQFEREPTAEEMAELLNLELSDVMQNLTSNGRHLSIDSPFAEGEEGSLLDVLENKNAERADAHLVHRDSLQVEVERSLGTLPQVQKKVLCYYFGLGLDRPLTLEDIAAKLNLSRERIRQIKDKALAQLQKGSHAVVLRTYLGA